MTFKDSSEYVMFTLSTARKLFTVYKWYDIYWTVLSQELISILLQNEIKRFFMK